MPPHAGPAAGAFVSYLQSAVRDTSPQRAAKTATLCAGGASCAQLLPREAVPDALTWRSLHLMPSLSHREAAVRWSDATQRHRLCSQGSTCCIQTRDRQSNARDVATSARCSTSQCGRLTLAAGCTATPASTSSDWRSGRSDGAHKHQTTCKQHSLPNMAKDITSQSLFCWHALSVVICSPLKGVASRL